VSTGQNDYVDLQAIHHRSEKGILAPRRMRGEEPEFSAQARETHAAGVVTLKLVVDQSGRPRNIQVVGPRGLGLDEKAVERVSTWQFAPATKEGKPVEAEIAIEVDFHYE
jgi:protein TonB